MAKNYKNVYTIMEKVKKGELEQTGSSRFTSIFDTYKRPDLISPHLHYLDVSNLSSFIKPYFNQYAHRYTNHYQTGSSTAKFEETQQKLAQMHPGRKVYDPNVVYDTYNKIPRSLKNDIFNMYNKPIDKIEFEGRTDNNKLRYKLLEMANDASLKIITESSNLKSAYLTKTMLTYLVHVMLKLKDNDPEAYDEMCNQLDDSNKSDKSDKSENGDKDNDGGDQAQAGTGSGSGGKQTRQQKAIDKALESSKSKLEEQLASAAEELSELSEHITDQELESQFEQGSGAGLSKDQIQHAINTLKKIQINEDALKNNIKVILDKSKNYFSGQERVIYESLLESGNFDGLEDYIMLHPKLRQLFPEDITTKSVERKGKINLYVDISGSMSENVGISGLSKLDFAKAVLLVMKKNKMLNKVYVFNSEVQEYSDSDFSVALLDTYGGTSLNAVVEHVKKHQQNSLVLTDAEDRCYRYSEKVYWLGVKGTRFSFFNKEVLDQYYNNQMCVFDGKKILSVDRSGNTI